VTDDHKIGLRLKLSIGMTLDLVLSDRKALAELEEHRKAGGQEWLVLSRKGGSQLHLVTGWVVWLWKQECIVSSNVRYSNACSWAL
jgi:hypothetical protein